MRSQSLLVGLALGLALGLGAGCHDKTQAVDPALQPPPGTGLVTIDMDGMWVVTDLQRTDGSGQPVPVAGGPFQPLWPVHENQVLVVAGGRLLGDDGHPLWEYTGNLPNERYLNVADGRFLCFDFLNRGGSECMWHYEVRAAFGSVDENTMDGLLEVRTWSSCLGPTWITPDPNGSFALRLVRAVPRSAAAAAPPATSAR